MASATSGVEGDLALILSPYREVGQGECLSFSVFIVFSEASSFNQLAILQRPQAYKHSMLTKLYDFRHWDRVRLAVKCGPVITQLVFSAFTSGLCAAIHPCLTEMASDA